MTQMVLSEVYIDGKTYRRGYTTGTTATAAAYAAALFAVGEEAEPFVSVKLPSGLQLEVPVHKRWQEGDRFYASVLKDGGDDIDVTNGLEIIASVNLLSKTSECTDASEVVEAAEMSETVGTVPVTRPKIVIIAGEGIGTVTKEGLQVPVGEPAINPVPKQMILEHVRLAIGDMQGAELTLTIPEGVAAAKRTFNPRLGIVDGISIIGTTGIVEPMSEEAWKTSLEVEMKQKAASGLTGIVLVPGNHGEKFATEQFGVSKDVVVTMSNFVGYMLMSAVQMHMKRVLIVGHIGKLIKLAGGIFHTHSRVADARNDVFCNHLAAMRAPYDLIDAVRISNTTDEAVGILRGSGFESVYDRLAEEARKRCHMHVYDELEVHVALYDMKGNLLGTTLPKESANQWLSEGE